HDARVGRGDQGGGSGAGTVCRRASRETDLPGDPDRRQRGARAARRRADAGRVARRDLLPLARGPSRQAVPRPPPPRLHLPARPAGLRLRPPARGRAGAPSRDRAERRRDRGQPARFERPPARRAQARGRRVSPPAATAAARARAATPAPLRLPPAPRRVSGPDRHPRAAVATPQAGASPFLRLIDHPWLERLVRGRAWIAIVAVALLGIVAMQVALLRLGAQIGSETATVNALVQQNETAEAAIGQLEASGGGSTPG